MAIILSQLVKQQGVINDHYVQKVVSTNLPKCRELVPRLEALNEDRDEASLENSRRQHFDRSQVGEISLLKKRRRGPTT